MVENGELLKDDPGQNPDPGHYPGFPDPA